MKYVCMNIYDRTQRGVGRLIDHIKHQQQADSLSISILILFDSRFECELDIFGTFFSKWKMTNFYESKRVT